MAPQLVGCILLFNGHVDSLLQLNAQLFEHEVVEVCNHVAQRTTKSPWQAVSTRFAYDSGALGIPVEIYDFGRLAFALTSGMVARSQGRGAVSAILAAESDEDATWQQQEAYPQACTHVG